jgi:Tol biopolymer transport system component
MMKKLTPLFLISILASTTIFCSVLTKDANPDQERESTPIEENVQVEATAEFTPTVTATDIPPTEDFSSLGKITFISGGDIYVMDADGSNATNITNTPDIFEMNPKISLDGEQIVFVTLKEYKIYIIDADGDNRTQITFGDNKDEMPSWTPDGHIIFVSDRGDYPGLYIMNSDGSDESLLLESSDEYKLIYDPTCSLDGTRIALSYGFDIFVLDIKTDELTQLTFDGQLNVNPSWSPDGNFIAYHSQKEFGNLEIYLLDVETLEETNLTNNPDYDQQPSFSADGQRLLFASTRDGGLNLYSMRTDGAGLVQLTFDYAAEPHWQPAE